MRRLAGLAVTAALGMPPTAAGREIVKTVGSLSVRVQADAAFPGGLLVVHLVAPRRLGASYAIFAGRRIRLLPAERGPRALVPIPVTTAAGDAVLGIEIRGRRGRRRIAVPVALRERSYPARSVALPPEKRSLLTSGRALRDGRRVLQALRRVSPQAHWQEPFRPPVDGPPGTAFGGKQHYLGVASSVEALTDSVFGEYHRGLDYDVVEGTPVRAPADGQVALSADLSLTGGTLVVDHGRGLHSVFFHLSRRDVVEQQQVTAGALLGLSGATGLAAFPHLHWGIYAHEVAVDPETVMQPFTTRSEPHSGHREAPRNAAPSPVEP